MTLQTMVGSGSERDYQHGPFMQSLYCQKVSRTIALQCGSLIVLVRTGPALAASCLGSHVEQLPASFRELP